MLDFENWITEAIVEREDNFFLVMTDYENAIEVRFDVDMGFGKTQATITADFETTPEQKELLFTKVETWIKENRELTENEIYANRDEEYINTSDWHA